MKKLYYLAIAAIVAICLSSCKSESPTFNQSDLQGLWRKNNSQEFVRFTSEKSDEASYLLGCEWNEAEDVHESDRLEAREKVGHPGNGWFKYELKTSGSLTEIHLTDNDGAEIPKIYVVTKLTSTDLEYHEKDKENWKFSFTKVVESK